MDRPSRECPYWANGRGCKRDHITPDCCRKGYHDPSKRKLNLCRRFQRGRCDLGDSCHRLHECEEQEPSAGPGSSFPHDEVNARKLTTDYLVRSLLSQMQQDIANGLNTKHQFRTFYAARLHPDKWNNWGDLATIMTEVFKQLESYKEAYLAGTMA